MAATKYASPTAAPSCAAALDNISATEWRIALYNEETPSLELHSIISVLPNGGFGYHRRLRVVDELHSIISVLPNGGATDQQSAILNISLHSIVSVLPHSEKDPPALSHL